MKVMPYEKYKPANAGWLSALPEAWDQIRGRFVMAVNPPPRRARTLDDTDEVSFVPMEAVGEYGGLDLERTKPLDEIGAGYTAFEDGDVVIAKITPCFENGKGAIASGLKNGVGFGTTELHVLRTGKHLDKQFLFYLTISHSFRMLGESEMYGAGGQKRVPPEFAKDFRIPLPPLDEQQTIARFLDTKTAQIDALVAQKRQLIDKLREKRQALIARTVTRGLPPEAAKAVGLEPNPEMKDSGVDWLGAVPARWKIKAIKWATPVQRGASPRPIDDPSYFDDDGEYAWVRISDVTAAGMYLDATEQRLSDLGSSLSVKMQPGSLFLSIAGTVGKPCIANIKCCIHDGFVYFPRWKGDSRFLFYVFASGEPYKGLGKMGTQLNLNTDTVGSIVIGIPDAAEQRLIADYLDRTTAELDSMTTAVEAAIDRLVEYRQAVITSAVTGKIDVRELA
ncbi:MAG: restriction endonuclease subunit S [Halothiobacillaceae bacterium]